MRSGIKGKILIVDDDTHIQDVLKFALEKAEFRTDLAMNGVEACSKALTEHYDLIVLDITMPEMDGLEVCRKLRQHLSTPILFLSSRDEEIDRIVGLELGGDDYLTKPFSPRELVLRVQTILRRSKPRSDDSRPVLARGKLKLAQESYQVSWEDKSVRLTATEFNILSVLFGYPNKVFSRDEILNRVYSDSVVSDRTVDSHVRRIRQKLAAIGGENIIESLHGLGYKLGDCK